MLNLPDTTDRIVRQAMQLGFELQQRDAAEREQNRLANLAAVLGLSVALNIVAICWFLMWRLS